MSFCNIMGHNLSKKQDISQVELDRYLSLFVTIRATINTRGDSYT